MPAIRQETVTLKGELTTWRVAGADGWGIGTLATSSGDVALTGKVVGARAGDSLEVTGAWNEHPRYGRQLKVRRATVARPESSDGIVAWLASTLPDVGVGRARALVERFGAGLWDVIEDDHRRLSEVNGITEARAEAIRAAYFDNKAQRDDMIKLRGWGLTDGQIARCVSEWGSVAEVVSHVRDNPYQLSRHVWGFGFKRADAVATKAGVAHDHPLRIEAGVEHVLEEATVAGHCYVAGGALQKLASELLGVSPQLVAQGIRATFASGTSVRRGWRIYPARMDRAETTCAQALRRLLKRAS